MSIKTTAPSMKRGQKTKVYPYIEQVHEGLFAGCLEVIRPVPGGGKKTTTSRLFFEPSAAAARSWLTGRVAALKSEHPTNRFMPVARQVRVAA